METLQVLLMYLGFGVAAVALFGVLIIGRRLARLESELDELWGE